MIADETEQWTDGDEKEQITDKEIIRNAGKKHI